MHLPEQQYRIQFLGPGVSERPADAPLPESVNHGPEVLPRGRQLILADVRPRPMESLEDAGVLEVAKPRGEQRPRNAGQPALDRVEVAAAGEQLADDERRPPIGEDFGSVFFFGRWGGAPRRRRLTASCLKQGAQRAAGVAKENPLGLAIGATAVGFVAGLLIPSTRVEDEKIGPMADQVKDKAKETGQEALERGKHVAQEAAQTVKEEGRQQAQEMAPSS